MIAGKKGDETGIGKIAAIIFVLLLLILLIVAFQGSWRPLIGSVKENVESTVAGSKTASQINKDFFVDLSKKGAEGVEQKTLDEAKSLDCVNPEKYRAAVTEYNSLINLCAERAAKKKEKDGQCSKLDETHYNFGNCYAKFNKCEEAIKEYNIVLDQYKESIYLNSARVEMAKCYISLNKFSEAREVAKNLDTISKENIEELISKREEYLKVTGTDFEKSYREALKAYNIDDYEKSTEKFNSLTQKVVELARQKNINIGEDFGGIIYNLPISRTTEPVAITTIFKNEIEKGTITTQRDIEEYLLVLNFWASLSKLQTSRNCEEFRMNTISPFRIDDKDYRDNKKYGGVKFFEITGTDYSGEPIVSRTLLELGKCYENGANINLAQKYYTLLIMRYPEINLNAGKPGSKERIVNVAVQDLFKLHNPNCGDSRLNDDEPRCNEVNNRFISKLQIGNLPIWREFTCWYYDKPSFIDDFSWNSGTDNECRTCATAESCEAYGRKWNSPDPSYKKDPCNLGCLAY